MKQLYTLLLVLLSTTGFGEDSFLDSLKLLINPTQQDSIRFKGYFELGNYYQYNNPDTAIYFHGKAYEIANSIKGIDGEIKKIKSSREIAWDYYLKGE